MSYLQDFKNHLENKDLSGFTQLWEEYCTSDQVDVEELLQILEDLKNSKLSKTFGPYIETALPLWQSIEDKEQAYHVLRLIMDIQNSNSDRLADVAYSILQERYGDHTYFNEKIRLVGLRSRENFQGAITNFELLNHMDKGKFVFHDGGWGVGEIIDISLVREELVIEFDYVQGKKYMSFENAFNVLVSLPSDHFLSRRFGNPEALEALAKKEPLIVLHMLLHDLGPKTAAEIKEELCELVIPEDEWSKWWQNTRNKAKKDTKIAAPSSVKEPFALREQALSHNDRFLTALKKKLSTSNLLLTVYSFLRDFPEILKNEESKDLLKEKLLETLSSSDLQLAQNFQTRLLLHDYFPDSLQAPIEEFVQELPKEKIISLLESIHIAAFKKRMLILIQRHREDWGKIFSDLFFVLQQNALRDYLLKELLDSDHKATFSAEVRSLRANPTSFPNAFVWYFQRILNDDTLPQADEEGKAAFFESFLILLSALGESVEHRELTKRMLQTLSHKRFQLVREILKSASLEYTKEFMLLVSKCRILPQHDIKVLHSLAEVVHPSLKSSSKASEEAEEILWTTQEAYDKIREKIEHIGSVEVVKNAKEIEAARALGDLRENSEYKFALEKRSRLQSELRTLSGQLNRARVITEEDVSTSTVGIGSYVTLKNADGSTESFTILGPWDTDPEEKIISSQSKIAQELWDKKVGDQVVVQDQECVIESIGSFFTKVR